MNDNQYVEEKIEDFFTLRNLDEANKAIKELLEKNGSLQEEVRKLKREQEIQSIRLCEILEQRNKASEYLEARNNETQNQSFQQENLINQLSNANEEIMSLGAKNERLRNDLSTKRKINERLKVYPNFEKQLNERIMNSQVDMDQVNQ